MENFGLMISVGKTMRKRTNELESMVGCHNFKRGSMCGKLALVFIVVLLVASSCRFVAAVASNNHDEGCAASSSHSVGEFMTETGFYQSIRLSRGEPLLERKSRYQDIRVHHSPYYGRILILDGVVQITERDADSYNEMMAHVPMFQHANPRSVLVIGGGDGYVLSEVLKHPSVERVVHVDLDDQVIEVCKEYFPWTKAWDDPRVSLRVADGAAFVRDAPDASYDVIIQDSSDPTAWGPDGEEVILPSSVLYSREHFANVHRILKPDGIFNLQSETLQIPSDLDGTTEWRRTALEVGFGSARYGSVMISSYPTGQIGFLLCEKDPSKAADYRSIQESYRHMIKDDAKATTYYHPRLQKSSFDLPLWAERRIYGLEGYKPPVCLDNETDRTSEQ